MKRLVKSQSTQQSKMDPTCSHVEMHGPSTSPNSKNLCMPELGAASSLRRSREFFDVNETMVNREIYIQ